MTRQDMRLWHHRLAEDLQITPGRAKKLLVSGKLPDEFSRDHTQRACHDTQYIAALAHARTQFDTAVGPLIDDLRTLIFRLRDGYSEAAAPNRRLVEFRFHDFGEHGRGAYPIDRHDRPWRDHRAPVTRVELIEAGYPDYHAVFHGDFDNAYNAPYRYKDKTESAFNNVSKGGEIQLMPFDAYWRPDRAAYLRLPLADFLERLAGIIEARRPPRAP